MRHHEAAHVPPAEAHATARGPGHEFEWLFLEPPVPPAVAFGKVARQRGRHRLSERAVCHSQRLQNPLRQKLLIRHSGNLLHDERGQRGAVVGIGRHLPRWKHTLRQVAFEQLAERLDTARLPGEQADHALLESSGVGHQVFQRDRLTESGRNLKTLQVAVDVRVQIQPPLFHQLHDRGPDEQLRVGSDPKQRALRIHRLASGEIRIAIALVQDDPPVPDHDHHGAGEVMGLTLRRHQPVNPTRQ